MNFIIETKNDKVLIDAIDKDHAFAKYFKDIIEQHIPLEKIGNILMLTDEKGEQYPMRTVPLLWKMGALGTAHAIDNIANLLGVSHSEAKKMLKETANKDAHLVSLIDQVKLEEEGETI